MLSQVQTQNTPLSPLALPIREPISAKNRRKQPRLKTRFLVRPSGSDHVFGGVDLSQGGLMCTGDDPLWPGNIVMLELTLPGDSHPLIVKGRVVDLVSYEKQIAMRIRFTELSHTAEKRIGHFMIAFPS